jgi:hypothetical protein
MTAAARYFAACARLGLPVWRRGAVDTDGNVCPGAWADERKAEPDFTDPATVGCLLAAAREAWQDHGLATVGRYQHAGRRWTLATGHRHGSTLRAVAAVEHDTEADALIAALEAAAARRGGQP